MASDSKPELVYFDGRGLAEIIRLTLTVAGVEYTERDLRTREEFVALLPDLLFAQVPLLRIDGLNLVQSQAIVRHVARKGRLLGEKEPEISRIDVLFQGSRDFMNVFSGIGFSTDEQKLLQNKPAVAKYLNVFNKVLKENGSGFLVGSQITLADLGVLEGLLATKDYFGQEIFVDYPEIEKYLTSITALERVSKYVNGVRKPKKYSRICGRS